VAKILVGEPNTFVCCYHSRHFTIQRYQIEKRLDELLNRKGGNQHILEDGEIRACIKKSGGNARIVVVATPVEEVGRDHDFDWAIIEPSSTQSIVQTAGRVNRHRQIGVSAPNVAILQFNFKEVERKGCKAVFTRPGYEDDDNGSSTHPSHDICSLIDESKINTRLDSSLRFDTVSHKFSAYDTNSISESLKRFFGPIIKNDSKWMDSDFYKEASLRDEDTMDSWFLDEDNKWKKYEFAPEIRFKKEYLVYQAVERNSRWKFQDKDNELFVLSLGEMRKLAEDVGIPANEAFSVQVYPDSQDDKVIEAKKYIMTPFGCEEV
jgi:CRISPR-associated endonuclease/helicase Cas3